MSTIIDHSSSLLWKTFDGKTIRLRNMSTADLFNCVKRIERTKGPNAYRMAIKFKDWVEYMKEELKLRLSITDSVSFLDV